VTLETEPSSAEWTTIEFPTNEGFHGVGRLVLGGIASRFELPIDRIDDLLLAAESLLLQPPAGDTIRIEARVTASGLVVRIGPFSPGRLTNPGVRRVLDSLVDELDEVDGEDGAGSMVELLVSAAHRTDAG